MPAFDIALLFPSIIYRCRLRRATPTFLRRRDIIISIPVAADIFRHGIFLRERYSHFRFRHYFATPSPSSLILRHAIDARPDAADISPFRPRCRRRRHDYRFRDFRMPLPLRAAAATPLRRSPPRLFTPLLIEMRLIRFTPLFHYATCRH